LSTATSPARRSWLQGLGLPVLLHIALCLGLYQYGLSNAEMSRLQIAGPSHLIDAYVNAVHVYGPLGVVRAYLRGESDERLYLEYDKLLLQGRADMAYIADRQNDPHVLEQALPVRAWPYRDVRVEYPPLAFLGTLPPALISQDYFGFRRAFAAYMLLLHFLNLWLAQRLIWPGPAQREHSVRAAWASLAFCAALGTLFVTRLDHLVATATLLVCWCFARTQAAVGGKRSAWAAATGCMAALGVMTKLVPGLACLAALVLWLRSRASDKYRLILTCAATGAFVLIALNAAMYALAGDHYLATYRYHTDRGVQLESLYSGVLLLLRPFGLPMHIDESFGSTNLASAFTPLVKALSPLLFVLGAGWVLARRRFSPDGLGAIVLSSVLLLIFMLTNRVFSPQYLIWIGAFASVLYAREPRSRMWPCLLAAVLLSQLIFPRGYPVLKAFHPLGILALDLRNGLLVAFTIMLVRSHSQGGALSRSD
jgi:hypothetical protein